MPKYTVTGSAPDEIYGKRVKADDPIELSEAQAEAHLRRGHIAPVSDAKPVEAPKPAAAPKSALKAEKADDGKRD